MLMSVLDKLTVPWRALIVGGGPLERALREWAARHGERVRIVSGVTHDEVPRYLNAMDLLSAPSQTLRAGRSSSANADRSVRVRGPGRRQR